MAQYGHNFYGTAYYGKTNAFTGWYTTREIFTDETLKSTVTMNIRATLPSATYDANSPEVTKKGTWAYDSSFKNWNTDAASAEMGLVATSDEITIKYEQRTTAATVTVEVTTTLPGKTPTVQTFTLNSQGATVNANATYKISNLAYGEQKVRIILGVSNPVGTKFYFKGFVARTANLTIESRARLDNTDWTDAAYTKVATTVSPIANTTNEYIVSGITPNYSGKNKIQLRVYLASSDNETTPEVQYIETMSGDTSNRSANGQWTGVFNMAEIAIQASASFSKVEEVVWTENVPAATSLTIRSQSSSDNLNAWDKVTVPYKQDSKRIRLKDGYNTGWIDSPFISPGSLRPYISTKEWDKMEDRCFLPPDSAGTDITYDFISIQKDNTVNPYLRMKPMETDDRNLRGSRLRNLDSVLRITLKRSAGKQTPVVDYVKLTSQMQYKQDVVIEDQEFSAVDFNNTGKGIVQDMNLAAFKNQFQVPAETSLPTYELIDATNRPQDIVFYLDSEKSEAIRTHKTTTLNNKVWAEAKVQASSSGTGLIKNYQYGGGQVSFPLKDEIQLAPVFTPSLKGGVKYRYYLDLGWPTQYHTVGTGDTLDLIAEMNGKSVAEFQAVNPKILYNNDGSLVLGQKLQVPNDTANNDVKIYWKSTNNATTSKSSQNAVLDGLANVESDSVVAEVAEASTYGWVDWVSEEKIYDGVVNLNDIRDEYKRTHITPTSGDSVQVEYTAVSGDTYKKIADRFGVYEDDVRRMNGATATDQQPTVGQVVQVPSRIILPSIHPKAIVTDNPYDIDIVYNSVKKTDGKILSTSLMTVKPVEIEYKEVTMTDVEVTRGAITNGKDLLKHARVIRIIRAQNSAKTRIYNPWNSTLNTGDFKTSGNYIDWSPTAGTSAEPTANETYYVDYVIEVPYKVTVTIDTTYQEEGGVDRIWRSPEVKEFKGMCYPGKDFVAELPAFNQWMGLPDLNVEDIEYVVEDNDIWVKTWVEKRNNKWYFIGSLQDRVPKDNWFPTIKTGYYYLGKEEYYLFNEPITIEPTDKEIPVAKNVDFVEGKFQNAVQVQEGSTNLIRNSGFDTSSQKAVTYSLTFESAGVAGLGITI